MPIEDFDHMTHGKSKSSDQQILTKAFLSVESSDSESSGGQCIKHGKPFEIYCNTCEKDICVDCALFYDHRGHQIERNDGGQKLPSQAMDLRQRAEKMIETSDELSLKFEKEILHKREEIKQLVEEKFNEMIDELDKARSIALDFVTNHYESYQRKVRERIDFSREKIEKFISSLSKLTRPFETFKIEFEVLERNYGSELLSDPMSSDPLVVTFNEQLIESIQAYCKTSLIGLKKRTSSTLKFMDDINLLQESLNESTFKEINESSAGIEDKINQTYQSSQLMVNRSTIKSGSFAHTNNPKPHLGSDLKRSFCGTPVNPNKLDRPGSVFHLNDDAFRKIDHLNISGAVSKQRQTEMPNGLGRSRIESQPFSERVSKPDAITPKRQTSRPAFRQTNEQRPSTYTRPNSSRPGTRLQCLNLAHFGLDDNKLEAHLGQTDISHTVKTITLSGNHITDRGVKFLLKTITPLNVETLFLSENSLRDRALDYFISFSKYNTSLKSVFLQDNKIDSKSSENKAKINKLKRAGIQVFL